MNILTGGIYARIRYRSLLLLAIGLINSLPSFVVIGQTPDNLPPELVRYADFVFTNGEILTADADHDFTIAEAVAVRGNRILAVGLNEKINRYAGPDTRRIDFLRAGKKIQESSARGVGYDCGGAAEFVCLLQGAVAEQAVEDVE